MVGDSDDVLFHVVPFASNALVVPIKLPLPLCNDVDIPDGTWAFDAEWMLRLVGPLAVDDAVVVAAADAAVDPRWPCNWTLFNDDDIRFVVELAWLIAGDVLDDDVRLLVDAVNALEDECNDAVPPDVCESKAKLLNGIWNWKYMCVWITYRWRWQMRRQLWLRYDRCCWMMMIAGIGILLRCWCCDGAGLRCGPFMLSGWCSWWHLIMWWHRCRRGWCGRCAGLQKPWIATRLGRGRLWITTMMADNDGLGTRLQINCRSVTIHHFRRVRWYSSFEEYLLFTIDLGSFAQTDIWRNKNK